MSLPVLGMIFSSITFLPPLTATFVSEFECATQYWLPIRFLILTLLLSHYSFSDTNAYILPLLGPISNDFEAAVRRHFMEQLAILAKVSLLYSVQHLFIYSHITRSFPQFWYRSSKLFYSDLLFRWWWSRLSSCDQPHSPCYCCSTWGRKAWGWYSHDLENSS